MHVYCDFDGTISIEDATDFVLSRLADPEWQIVEQLWQDGAIGSGECMRRQISMIRASLSELDEVLDDIAVDPFFASFVDLCAIHRVPVTVISDGVDYFIKRILRKHGLDHLPVIANKLVVREHGEQISYDLFSPHAHGRCEATAGVCKCRALTTHGQTIYVGDGRSDFCVSNKPDLVFAKDRLAEYCAGKEIPFFAYEDFGDVVATLKAMAPCFQTRVGDTPRYATA